MPALTEVSIALIAVAGFVLVFAFWIALLPMIYGYRISHDRVEVMVLGIVPIFSLDHRNIVEVRKEKLWPTFFYPPFRTLRLGNRLSGESVIIVRPGLIKYIIFTPKNATASYNSMKAIAPASASFER